MKGFNSRYLHFWESSSEKKKPFPKLGKRDCRKKGLSPNWERVLFLKMAIPQLGEACFKKKETLPNLGKAILKKNDFPKIVMDKKRD
ncbi:hypothetical protein [Marinifilum flexuosum]|uniref:hypothetical protein n=1 Tax=Marinifilum flexuosum TaxID=1117708 RepID=UPI000E715F27|nr:hypothetical protein [Marinifilum flexuosum]